MYKGLIKEINKGIKENLEKDGRLAPIALIMKDKKIIAPLFPTFGNDEAKYMSYTYIGAILKIAEADGAVLINDAAMKSYDSAEEAEYARENYSSEMPLTYPESMRQDGIFFQIISVKKREIVEAYFQRYEKKEGKFKFYALDDKYSKATKMGGMLLSCILKGYNLPVSKKDFEKYIQDKGTSDK